MILDVRDIPKPILLNVLYDYALLILSTRECTTPLETEENQEDLADDRSEAGFWEEFYSRPISPLRIALDHVRYQKNKYYDSVDLGSGDVKLNVSFFFLRYFDSSGFDALYGAGAALNAITTWKEDMARKRALARPRLRRRLTM